MKTIIMFLLILFYAGSLNSQYKNLFPSLKNEIVTLRDSSESGIVITKTDECNIFLKDRSMLTEVSTYLCFVQPFSVSWICAIEII